MAEKVWYALADISSGPSSDYFYKNGGDGSTYYSCLDEQESAGHPSGYVDTDFVQHLNYPSGYGTIVYGLDVRAEGMGSINVEVPTGATSISVRLHYRVKAQSGKQTGTITGGIKSSTTTSLDTERTATDWAYFYKDYSTNPNGGGAWTPATVNAIQLVEYGKGGAKGFAGMSQMYVVVTYTPPAEGSESSSASSSPSASSSSSPSSSVSSSPSSSPSASPSPGDTGLEICTSGVTDSSSTADWINPENIAVDDDSFAQAASDSGGGEDSSNLIATGFDFSAIPEDATITGVETTVRLRTGADSWDVVYDTELSLVVTGGIDGDNKANVTAWPSTFTNKVYGADDDLWNTTAPLDVLTVQDTVNFGVSLRCYITGGGGMSRYTYADVAWVKMTIYYTSETAGSSSESSSVSISPSSSPSSSTSSSPSTSPSSSTSASPSTSPSSSISASSSASSSPSHSPSSSASASPSSSPSSSVSASSSMSSSASSSPSSSASQSPSTSPSSSISASSSASASPSSSPSSSNSPSTSSSPSSSQSSSPSLSPSSSASPSPSSSPSSSESRSVSASSSASASPSSSPSNSPSTSPSSSESASVSASSSESTSPSTSPSSSISSSPSTSPSSSVSASSSSPSGSPSSSPSTSPSSSISESSSDSESPSSSPSSSPSTSPSASVSQSSSASASPSTSPSAGEMDTYVWFDTANQWFEIVVQGAPVAHFKSGSPLTLNGIEGQSDNYFSILDSDDNNVWRVNSTKQLIYGNPLTLGAQQIGVFVDNNYGQLFYQCSSDNTAHNNSFYFRRSGGTNQEPTACTNGMGVFSILGLPRGSSAFAANFLMQAKVEGTPSGNTVPVWYNLLVGETTATTLSRMAVHATNALGGMVFNEDGDDYDFRIEGDTITNLFNLDASADGVGIGIAPTSRLHLMAGTATAGQAPLKFTAGVLNTSAELGAVEFTDNGTDGHLYITLNVGGTLTRKEIAFV